MRIRQIETFAIRVPRDLSAATGSAGSPTKLSGGGEYRWSEAYPALYSIHFETALIRITLENGLFGWGEAQAPLAPQVPCTIVNTLLAPVLFQEQFDGSISGVAGLWQRMYSAMRVRGQTGGFMLDAISGVDLALWDLAGKIASSPAACLRAPRHKLLIPAYLSGVPGSTPAERVENAKPYLNDGFDTIKLYFDQTPGEMLATIDAFLCRFSGLKIAVDGLWRFSLEDAIQFGKELDVRHARWFECPLLPELVDEHALLAANIQTSLAVGESYRTRWELRPFVQSVRVLQPDLGRSGLTESLEIARMAQQHSLEVIPHVSIAGGPQIAAALHFASIAGNCPLIEYNPRVLETANRFLRAPIRMEAGCYGVPEQAGLGVDLVEIPTDFVLSHEITRRS
ncbi:MAG TPA: mandelate racemase/muconate lactonizing enzyme family protein [Bryobacteraceae bacterium]